jgi:hypothetical protein
MKYIIKYDLCQRNKIQKNKQYNEITQISALSKLWELIIMNFVMKLSSLKNSAWEVKFDNILIIVNRLIKYTMFIAFKETVTASIMIYMILQKLISNYRLLKKFITDRDKLFMSKFWEMFTVKLRIKHKMLTAYHLQTDKQSKKMN